MFLWWNNQNIWSAGTWDGIDGTGVHSGLRGATSHLTKNVVMKWPLLSTCFGGGNQFTCGLKPDLHSAAGRMEELRLVQCGEFWRRVPLGHRAYHCTRRVFRSLDSGREPRARVAASPHPPRHADKAARNRAPRPMRLDDNLPIVPRTRPLAPAPHPPQHLADPHKLAPHSSWLARARSGRPAGPCDTRAMLRRPSDEVDLPSHSFPRQAQAPMSCARPRRLRRPHLALRYPAPPTSEQMASYLH